jgi:hypothetical protein
MDTNTVQVTIIEDKPKDANALAVLVRAALDGYGGNTIAEIRLTNQVTDVFEAIDLFTLTQTYDVRVVRDNVTVPSALADLGELYLDDIYDVDATSPARYSRLEYNASASVWESTPDLNIDGAVYSNPRLITLTNGTTFTVASDDHLIFCNYASGSGSASSTLRLPEVATSEGREVRIKTGSHLSNQRTLTLRPATADTTVTIDGSASASMDRDYDGITVHCIDKQWYITQRKSK